MSFFETSKFLSLLLETNLRGLRAFEIKACILDVICYQLIFLLQVPCSLDNVHNMKGVSSSKSEYDAEIPCVIYNTQTVTAYLMFAGPSTRVSIKDATIIENPLKSRGSVDGIEMSPNIKVDLDDFIESRLDIGEQEEEKGDEEAEEKEKEQGPAATAKKQVPIAV
jgi:hypothetical protein